MSSDRWLPTVSYQYDLTCRSLSMLHIAESRIAVEQAKTLLSGAACDMTSSTHLSVHLTIHSSFTDISSIHPSIYLLIYVLIYHISIHYLLIYLSTHPSIHPSIHLRDTAIDSSAIEKIRSLQVVAMVRRVVSRMRERGRVSMSMNSTRWLVIYICVDDTAHHLCCYIISTINSPH